MIKISGHSDDLIEIEGDIVEEFNVYGHDESCLLAFSDGTLLRVVFSDSGIWRITPVAVGSSVLHIGQATEDDGDTDVATLSGVRIAWVVCGTAFAKNHSKAEAPAAVPSGEE